VEKVFGFVKRLDKCCSVDAFVVAVEGFAFWSLLLLLDDDMVGLIVSLLLQNKM